MKSSYQIVKKNGRGKLSKKDRTAFKTYFKHNGQALLPMVELIEQSRIAVDELIEVAGRTVIETVLMMSVENLTGPPHPGKRKGEVVRYGSQPGTVTLSDRKLKVDRPRVRKKGTGSGREVTIPAYQAMQDHAALGERMLSILMSGVSTRNYEHVIGETADSVGVSKSGVSRKFIDAGRAELARLLERRFDDTEILIIYIDGQEFAGHHVISAVGVDEQGRKHVLGLYAGATENSTAVAALLEDLVERGIGPERKRLFVIDGSKALRKGIDLVFGYDNPVQRCRIHKMRNVMGHLPEELKDQVRSVMKAAYRLEPKDGMRKLERQASWLEHEHPSAAASLLEGLEETFTVNRLGLPRTLRRCLCTTNLIESPHSGVRMRTRRVSRWRSREMVLYWAASAWSATEKNFRRIQGYRDLWILKSVLDADFTKDGFVRERSLG
ncbi:MAG: IS256 family transposase [Deltaproteobacteria bacterium]|nr:IS256 family transposase [Deltaproteobacteria bacterium]